MRLPRFTGDRIARQAIMYGRRLECDSRKAADLRRDASPENMDVRWRRDRGAESAGVVSASPTGASFRGVQEPIARS